MSQYNVEDEFYKRLKEINSTKDFSREYEKRKMELNTRGLTYYLLDELNKNFPNKQLGNVLNLGGDLGLDLKIIKEAGFSSNKMYSIDYYIPKTKIPEVNYLEGNIYVILRNLTDIKFNLIIFKEVIEHLFDPDSILISIQQLLAKDGVIFISTPNKSSFFNRIMLLFGYLPLCDEVSTIKDVGKFGKYNFSEGCNGHIRTFTFKSLIELVTYHGYKIITAKSVPSDSFQKSRLLILFEKLITKIDNKLGSSIILVVKKQSLS